MCGIVAGYVVKPESIKDMVFKIFDEQRTRGTNGFGLGIRKSNGALMRDRACLEKEIFDSWLWDHIEVGDYFLFHHRIPTSTFNTPECNHPIMIEDESLMVVHNGSLHTMPLFSEHDFETEVHTLKRTRNKVIMEVMDYTDTEVAAHAMEELVCMTGGNWQHSARLLGEEFKSTFVFLSTEYDGLLYSCRTNPLYAYKIDGNVYLSSQRGALKNFNVCKDLEPGHGTLRGSQIYHEKPDAWGRGVTTYHSSSCPVKKDEYQGAFGGYMRDVAEARSGIAHPDWYNKQELEENELRPKPNVDRTVNSYMRQHMGVQDWRGSQYPLVTGRSGARGAGWQEKPDNKHGCDWPGHPNYIWPTFALKDSEMDVLTLYKESEECYRIQGLDEPAGSNFDPIYDDVLDVEEQLDALDEAEEEVEDNEQWVARCELAGTYISRKDHGTMYPNCDDECNNCVFCSCPFHVIHETQRSRMRQDYRTGETTGEPLVDDQGNQWQIHEDYDWEGFTL